MLDVRLIMNHMVKSRSGRFRVQSR